MIQTKSEIKAQKLLLRAEAAVLPLPVEPLVATAARVAALTAIAMVAWLTVGSTLAVVLALGSAALAFLRQDGRSA